MNHTLQSDLILPAEALPILMSAGFLIFWLVCYLDSRTRLSYFIQSTVPAVPRSAPIRHNIVIWNSGATVITRTQIMGRFPLRIHGPDNAHSGSIKVLAETNPKLNRFGFTEDVDAPPNCAPIGFETLAPGDGALIEVLHSSLSPYIEVSGKLKGMLREVQPGRIDGMPHTALDYARLNSYGLLFVSLGASAMTLFEVLGFGHALVVMMAVHQAIYYSLSSESRVVLHRSHGFLTMPRGLPIIIDEAAVKT